MRTTIDIDDPIFEELKCLQWREGKSLGRLVSDLLAQSLAAACSSQTDVVPAFSWRSEVMRARVDLADKQAVLGAMDERSP